jgi:HSP20 family molecular chaperone IbpA
MAVMAPAQDLEVQQKRELEKKDESTIPARVFLPNTDIFETEDALTVVMEMPGVNREHADITVEDNVLSVAGRIDFSKYEKLQPVYTEYNVGYYRRSFNLSPNSFDEQRIGAEMKDGVLTVTLPKAERLKSRRIPLG